MIPIGRSPAAPTHPGLTLEDIQACLAYASATLRAEKVYPLMAA